MIFRGGIIKHGVAIFIRQRDMNVTALPGPIGRPFGHKGRHPILPLRKNLGIGFKEHGTIRCAQGIAVTNRSLQHTGSGLRMQAFKREIHRETKFQQIFIEFREDRVAQH